MSGKKLQWSSDRNPSAHIKMETNASNVIMLLKEKPNEEHAEEGKTDFILVKEEQEVQERPATDVQAQFSGWI